jgi:hypothetical protein
MPYKRKSPGRQAEAEGNGTIQANFLYSLRPLAVNEICALCLYFREIQRPLRMICTFWGERVSSEGGCKFFSPAPRGDL